ncbi:MAG TPA: hypothetical protein VNF08_00880 [Acidimicrobiales bacterium]|nr:hypothetical protein [Acidimicrobiales bacterium]
MEHRGLIGALSVALISLGASLLIAYGTASYARGKEFDWLSGYSRVGEAVVLVGVILLAATVVLTERQKWKLRRIAELTGSGNDFMDKLEVSITGVATAVPIMELNQLIIDWATSVDRWLEKYLPQYAMYFRNRGGHVELLWDITPPEGLQNDDTAAYAVNVSMLSGHLRRLAEITMKL